MKTKQENTIQKHKEQHEKMEKRIAERRAKWGYGYYQIGEKNE